VRDADRGHLDDLPLDQLEPIRGGEDTGLGHAAVLVSTVKRRRMTPVWSAIAASVRLRGVGVAPRAQRIETSTLTLASGGGGTPERPTCRCACWRC
jgi:hypothetical protein